VSENHPLILVVIQAVVGSSPIVSVRENVKAAHAGSIICFGSSRDEEFCGDTVFVVGSSEPWTSRRAHG
jgi:hypothetical protein